MGSDMTSKIIHIQERLEIKAEFKAIRENDRCRGQKKYSPLKG